SRRRHTRFSRDWSSDVCSSDLTFSRISSQAKKFEQVSLQEILEDVLADLYVTIETRGAEINADPLPTIEADPTQMRQLLQNLVRSEERRVRKDGRTELAECDER